MIEWCVAFSHGSRTLTTLWGALEAVWTKGYKYTMRKRKHRGEKTEELSRG